MIQRKSKKIARRSRKEYKDVLPRCKAIRDYPGDQLWFSTTIRSAVVFHHNQCVDQSNVVELAKFPTNQSCHTLTTEQTALLAPDQNSNANLTFMPSAAATNSNYNIEVLREISITVFVFNPLGPRTAVALFERNPMRREATVSNDLGIKV